MNTLPTRRSAWAIATLCGAVSLAVAGPELYQLVRPLPEVTAAPEAPANTALVTPLARVATDYTATLSPSTVDTTQSSGGGETVRADDSPPYPAPDGYAEAGEYESQADFVEDVLASEPLDPSGSVAVRHRVDEMLATLEATTEVMEVTCSVSTCRMTFDVESGGSETAEILLDSITDEFAGGGMTAYDEASASLVVYLGRNGEALVQEQDWDL